VAVAVAPHQLRHAFGSNVADAGGALDMIADLLGHRSVTSLQVYLNPDSAWLRRAVDAVVAGGRVDLGVGTPSTRRRKRRSSGKHHGDCRQGVPG
jgi:hypothetical protein